MTRTMRWLNNDPVFRVEEKFVRFFAVGVGWLFRFSGWFNYKWVCRVIYRELGLTSAKSKSLRGKNKPPFCEMHYRITSDV